MKKSNVLRITLIFVILLVCVLQINSFATSIEDTLETVEYTEEYKKWLNMTDEEKENCIVPRKYSIKDTDNNIYLGNTNFKLSLKSSQLFPSSYDLRDDIEIKIKDQGSTGQCWAFSINSAIESNVEKTTDEVSPVFSARYVEYSTAKTFLDGKNKNSYNREVGSGGFSEMALGLYTSGRGPVLESDMPFENNEQRIKLSQIQNIKTQKQIKDYVRFREIYKTYDRGRVNYTDASGSTYTNAEVLQIRNEIKQHILKYGAVVSQTYGIGGISRNAAKYYDNPSQITKSKAYFCNNPSLTADHQITIIGWDDNYAVTNFNSTYRPSTPGAYIVLNSWGENFGENGVYYISYEDCFIEKNVLGIISTTDIEYDNIYQHDELGNNYVVGANKDIYGANVFERTNNTKQEWLTEVSISSLVDVTCDIYVNSSNGQLSSEDLKKVATGIKIKNGYNTIELDQPIKLTGDKFAVVVKYILNQNGKSYFGIEYPDNNFWNTATANRGESYISLDLENWSDIIDLASATAIPKNSNLCIKAFTEYSDEYKYFDVNRYKIDSEYIYNISPKTKLKELTNNISTNMTYYIYDINGNIVEDDAVISTGMQVRNDMKTYKIVVKGDLNGDGKINIIDFVKYKLYNVNIKIPTKIEKIAMDINSDGKISIVDFAMLKLAIANIKEI